MLADEEHVGGRQEGVLQVMSSTQLYGDYGKSVIRQNFPIWENGRFNPVKFQLKKKNALFYMKKIFLSRKF